jgi:hypothetical protein
MLAPSAGRCLRAIVRTTGKTARRDLSFRAMGAWGTRPRFAELPAEIFSGNARMSDTGIDFGSLNDRLEKSCPAENLERSIDKDFVENFPEAARDLRAEARAGHMQNLMRSAGPISDAYILGHDPVMLITGPGGSGKTTASVKKALVEAQRIRPGSDGTRRYVLGTWRQKYDNLWKATIPSWWKILPRDLPGSKWVGASPRAAEHIVNFEDKWGPVQLIARFRAFGEIADPRICSATK